MGDVIVIDRAAYNQGENAQYEPYIERTETMPPLVARGPHAVAYPFVKSRRAQSKTDFETWKQGEVTNTLNLFDVGDVRTTTIIVHIYESHPQDSRINEVKSVMPTVSSKFSKGCADLPIIVHTVGDDDE